MISAELQAGIDSMKELISNSSGTDIASASVRFFRELFDALDAMQAELDAVPIEAIRFLYDGCDDVFSVEYINSSNKVVDWLETQVQEA